MTNEDKKIIPESESDENGCDAPQCHIPDEKKDIDELLETFWELREKGKITKTHLRESGVGRVFLESFEKLMDLKFIRIEGNHIKFTELGEKTASNLIRRHRLTERMLTDLFDIPTDRIEGPSCEFEHILSEEVTDSICSFLGHPTKCPHGKPIPPGECCHKLIKKIRPLVMPLNELNPGEKGRITFISSHDKRRLQRLSSLGIVPDGDVTLNQKLPTVVIQVGETEIALDKDIVSEIYVKRINGFHSAHGKDNV